MRWPISRRWNTLGRVNYSVLREGVDPITGVLGPHSNAHGPNEFLHLPTGKRVTMVVADVLARHGAARA